MIHTVESLRAFEQSVANAFNSGTIRSPVHLSGGNEQQLIDYFLTNYSADHVEATNAFIEKRAPNFTGE